MKKQTKLIGTPRLGLRGLMKNVGKELKTHIKPPTEEEFWECLKKHMLQSDWYTVEDGKVFSEDFPKKGVKYRFADVGGYFKEMVGDDPQKPGWTKPFKPWDHIKKADWDKCYEINEPIYGPKVKDWPKDRRPQEESQFNFIMVHKRRPRADRFTIYPVLNILEKQGFAESWIPEGGSTLDRMWRIRMADYENFNDISGKVSDKMET